MKDLDIKILAILKTIFYILRYGIEEAGKKAKKENEQLKIDLNNFRSGPSPTSKLIIK